MSMATKRHRVLCCWPVLGLTMGVLLWMGGCTLRGKGSNGAASTPFNSTTGVRLFAAPIGEQRHDRIAVKLYVINDTAAPIHWDSEFCVFINWRIKTEVGGDLEPVTSRVFDGNERPRSKARFVELMPGEELSKEFDLTRDLCHFMYGHGSSFSDPTVYIPMGYEEMIRFDIPRSAKTLSITAQYLAGQDCRAAFRLWFGYDLDDVGLPLDTFESAETTVRLRN